MVRMRLAGWIVVVPCFGEVIRTVTVLVDVHSIKVCGAGYLFVWQIEDFGFHQYATVRSLVEFYQPLRLGAALPPLTQAMAAGARKRSKSAKMSAGVTDWLVIWCLL